jgi:hypothetical protein
MFGPLFLAEIYAMTLLYKMAILYSSISRGITVNEFKQPWSYKYLFNVKEGKGLRGKAVYAHKEVGFFKGIWYWIRFFLLCSNKTEK